MESTARDTERAFRLAYFIQPDRSRALRVTVESLSHLDDLVTEQDRRRYSRPRARRTRVSRTRSQLLQHLVCCVAAAPATARRRKRRTGSRTADDLLVRFVIDLTRFAARRSSFYVNLGVSRILYEYSTAETMAMQDLLIQDPERARDEAYFRYGKGLLLKEMRQRHGSRLEIVRQARGELRFRSRRPSARQVALVEECLHLLTPWQTRCALPESFDPWHDPLPDLRFTGDHPDDEHPVDMGRIHTVLHPRCFQQATRALGLDPPAERLRVPRFLLDGEAGDRAAADAERSDTARSRRPRALSAEEKAAIADEVRARLERRRRWSLRQLSI